MSDSGEKPGNGGGEMTNKSEPENRAGNRPLPPEHSRFKPGQSGNPGGRPSVKPFRDEIRRALAEPDPKSQRSNLEEVVRVLLAQAKRGKVDAIREVLDRVDGRVESKVSTKLEATFQRLEGLSDEELEEVRKGGTLPAWFESEEPKA